MKIAIIATHSFPLPPETHTGDTVISDLAFALDRLGHSVDLYAAEGTNLCPPNGRLFTFPTSMGAAFPTSEYCETYCYDVHLHRLLGADVVHDFSNTKQVASKLFREARRENVVCTNMGGVWSHPSPSWNLCVWSQAMRERALRGATDYDNTPMPELGGDGYTPVRDAHVVPGGIDTSLYCPGSKPKENFILWMNRWHPAKGFREAIKAARAIGFELVMAGEHPDNERFSAQRDWALEAFAMADGAANIRFEWLPKDPDHHPAKIDLYQRARALLYPVQFHEPFGLSQVEAMACGTPVIGTRFGSVPEVVEHGITGFVCENSINSLRHAICTVDAIDPAVCRQQAVKRFDISVMAQNYLIEYQRVIDGEGWGR